ncbi:hypothetical protein [Klebsiella pneumoniae]|uniref:hypothetical protein n=1 Tax=Klebsiella pneumoniae TaxID=573 RepID=UPI001D0DBBF6|nr:hypothetical protein [Klebsiella pneumoniae]
MVTKDIYLKNGILYFADQDEGYKCFEFSGRGSVYEAVQRYSQVYIACDNNDYFLYNLVFSGGGAVKCICADNVTIHNENRLSIDCTYPPEQILRALNDIEREILYLYIIKRRKIKEISKLTCLSVSKISYKIRMIKIKFDAETTRKLPILFRRYL